MSQTPHADYANVRSTIERIAALASSESQPLIQVLADQLEQAFNRANNTTAIVVGNVELGLHNRLDNLALEVHALREQVGVERQEVGARLSELEQAIGEVLGLLRSEATNGD